MLQTMEAFSISCVLGHLVHPRDSLLFKLGDSDKIHCQARGELEMQDVGCEADTEAAEKGKTFASKKWKF